MLNVFVLNLRQGLKLGLLVIGSEIVDLLFKLLI